MSTPDYPLVVIVGPTASGKSRLALELASSLDGEILACDALQIYRHLDIGTAKPTAREQSVVPHHMINLREPGEEFSAGDYQRLARKTLADVRSRSRIPFIVGGTGFYLRALLQGFFVGPGRSDALRQRMHKIAERRGRPFLHRVLQRIDPTCARLIAPADYSRIVRSCEIFFLTGKPMSWWHKQPTVPLEGFRWLFLGIAWPRQELYTRIDRRVDDMIEAGFLDEVRSLRERFPAGCHAFKAIGYRQIADYLDNRCSLDQALESTRRESRRYAKRQLTWFRAMEEIQWLDGQLEWPEIEAQARCRAAAFLAR